VKLNAAYIAVQRATDGKTERIHREQCKPTVLYVVHKILLYTKCSAEPSIDSVLGTWFHPRRKTAALTHPGKHF